MKWWTDFLNSLLYYSFCYDIVISADCYKITAVVLGYNTKTWSIPLMIHKYLFHADVIY